MATVSEYVEFDVSAEDFDDEELIEELKSRGYKISEDENLDEVKWRWERGEKKEALIILEREFKWLRGISQLIN